MNLGTYILMRLFATIAQVLGALAIVFALFNIIPYDPSVFLLFGLRGADPEVRDRLIEQYRAQLGLDAPAYIQYLRYVKGLFVNGSLGTSWSTGASINTLVANALPFTVLTFGLAFLIYTPLAFVLGIVAANHRGKTFDFFSRAFTSMSYSIPSYLIGLWLVVFSIFYNLDLGPWPSRRPTSILLILKYSILPIISVILVYTGFQFRMVRTQILEIMRKNYIRFARAKGLEERTVIYKHMLRNLLPFYIMTIAVTFPIAFSGVAALEVVFNIPGVGFQMVRAANALDWPIIVGITVVFTLINGIMLTITDVLIFLISPKLRYQSAYR